MHAEHCRDAVLGEDIPYFSESARFLETLVGTRQYTWRVGESIVLMRDNQRPSLLKYQEILYVPLWKALPSVS